MTITSANSVFMLSFGSLFPIPQKLEGYATDDSFMADVVEIAQTAMGVDGKLSAGYVPNPTVMTITFQPDSPSIVKFEFLIAAMRQARDIFELSATIALPAIGRSYACVKGVLTEYKPLPDAKKLLQPVTYKITWQTIEVGAI